MTEREKDLRRIIRDVLSDVLEGKQPLSMTYLSDIYSEAIVQSISGMIDDRVTAFREELAQRISEE